MPIPSVDTFLKSAEFLESWGDFEKALEDPEELLNESVPSIILKCNEQPNQILPILLLFLSSQTQKDFLNFCKSIILGGDFDSTLQNLQNEVDITFSILKITKTLLHKHSSQQILIGETLFSNVQCSVATSIFSIPQFQTTRTNFNINQCNNSIDCDCIQMHDMWTCRIIVIII